MIRSLAPKSIKPTDENVSRIFLTMSFFEFWTTVGFSSWHITITLAAPVIGDAETLSRKSHPC